MSLDNATLLSFPAAGGRPSRGAQLEPHHLAVVVMYVDTPVIGEILDEEKSTVANGLHSDWRWPVGVVVGGLDANAIPPLGDGELDRAVGMPDGVSRARSSAAERETASLHQRLLFATHPRRNAALLRRSATQARRKTEPLLPLTPPGLVKTRGGHRLDQPVGRDGGHEQPWRPSSNAGGMSRSRHGYRLSCSPRLCSRPPSSMYAPSIPARNAKTTTE